MYLSCAALCSTEAPKLVLKESIVLLRISPRGAWCCNVHTACERQGVQALHSAAHKWTSVFRTSLAISSTALSMDTARSWDHWPGVTPEDYKKSVNLSLTLLLVYPYSITTLQLILMYVDFIKMFNSILWSMRHITWDRFQQS